MSTQFPNGILRVLFFTALMALWGCQDRPGVTEVNDPAQSLTPIAEVLVRQINHPLSARPPLPDVISGVSVGVPTVHDQPWLANMKSLRESIRRTSGRVMVGFKPGGAKSSIETGFVPPVSKATALQGRTLVEKVGGEIIRTYRNSSIVSAQIPLESVKVLAEAAIVDFVEPTLIGQLRHSTPPQDTTWGAWKLQAPTAWSKNYRGYNTVITILDSGIDEDHYSDSRGDAYTRVIDCAYVTPGFSDCWDDSGHGSHVLGIAGEPVQQTD